MVSRFVAGSNSQEVKKLLDEQLAKNTKAAASWGIGIWNKQSTAREVKEAEGVINVDSNLLCMYRT